MNFKTYRIAYLVCILLIVAYTAAFAAIPSAPSKDIYLADFAKMVDPEDRQQILDIGKDLDTSYGAQVVVVTVDTLDGQDIESYANDLFRKWGIGNKEKDNGVLLLIAKEDRKFRIEVGYGLEGAITDGYAGSVLDGMKGDFRSGKFSSAIMVAYGKLSQKVYEEYGATPPEKVAAVVKTSASADTAKAAEDEELTWWEMLLGVPIGLGLIAFFFWLLWQMLKLILVPAALLLNLLSSGRINIDVDRFFGGGGSGRDDDDDHFSGFGGSSHSSSSGSSGGSCGGGSYGGGRSGGGGASGGW